MRCCLDPAATKLTGRVVIHDRLDYRWKTVIEVDHGLKLIEYERGWSLFCLFSKYVEDIRDDRVDLPADELGSEAELRATVISHCDRRSHAQPSQVLPHCLAPPGPPCARNMEGRAQVLRQSSRRLVRGRDSRERAWVLKLAACVLPAGTIEVLP